MRVTGMIAEGDSLAADVRSHAATRTSKRYENDYHLLMEVRDGRIAAFKDTLI